VHTPARPSARDLLPALILVVFSVVGTRGASEHDGHSPGLAAYILAGAAAATLGARRFAPVAMLTTCGALVSAYLAAGYPFGPVLIALAVATVVVASRVPTARSLRVTLGVLVMLVIGLLVRLVEDPGLAKAFGLVATTGWLLVPWLVGTARRQHFETRERERVDEAERAIAAERLRIAAEVHDVAGHGLAVIAMQAGVALHVLERRPEQARIALEEIRAASTEALAGLRSTIAELRAPDSAAPRAPGPPGLEALDALLDRMRRAGLDVDLIIGGTGEASPGPVGAAAYRIVQESLTNVLRHAQAQHATVHLAREPDRLLLSVSDDGTASPGPPGAGIAGMRERAAALGGTLTAGPGPGGGFAVTAVLPVRGPAGAASR